MSGPRLEDDRMCYVCGKENSAGMRLDFEHPAPGRLSARVVFAKHHQGFKDIVHGGFVGMVLDEMMINLAWKEGLGAVTAELNVRLKRPTPVGAPVLFEGWIEGRKGRVLALGASAKDADGQLLAAATAKALVVSPGPSPGA